MFVVATSKSDPSDHLQLLGRLCRLFRSPAALLAATTAAAFVQALIELETHVRGPRLHSSV